MSDRIIIVYVNIDVEQRDKLAPLYRPLDDFGTLCAAFVQLDLADGEISFVVEAPFNSRRCPATCLRWQVRAELRGDRQERLAEQLRPLMQRICDDIEDAGEDLEVRLGPDAKAAKDEIESLLCGIDPRDPAWIADIRTVDDFVDGLPIGLTADSTDGELDILAGALEDEAESEKIVLNGSVRDALEIRREDLRKAKKAKP